MKNKRYSFDEIHSLAVKKYGSDLGMLGRLLTKSGNTISNKFISWGMNRIFTKEEILK